MEGLEFEQDSPKGNDMEVSSRMLHCEDGHKESSEGNDLDETASTLHSEEGDLESPRRSDVEETPDVGNQRIPKGKYMEETTSLMPQVECEGDGTPTAGMKFFSENEAYHFYNGYAARLGFSIRKGGIRHNSKGEIRQRNFVCSKEGLKADYGYGELQKGYKLDTRTDCKACIRLTVTDGVWEVTRFNLEHNHELAEPEQRKYLRSTRKFFEASPITSMVSTETVCHAQVEAVILPSVGMKVYSEGEAYSLYNVYATHTGFSIRKGGNRHNSKGELRQRNYVCSKQGLRVDDEPYRVRKVNRLETRTNCKARIRFTITDGVWEVTHFSPEHNHELVGPEQRKYLRSGRRISQANNVGIGASTDNDCKGQMKTNSCLTEEVGFPGLNGHNLLHTERKHIIRAGDAQNAIDHFKRKQAEDAMFFYSVQVDDNNRLINFFWRDGRSRIDYDCFGDVILFDNGSRTDKYSSVFVLFVGVNHHGKYVLFGCAILSDETLGSLTWLFETFLESMGNQQPKTIFTNQCQRTAVVIEKVFPRTCHHLDLWHIQECTIQQLSDIYADPEFKTKFNKCLYGCHKETEFQSTWNELIGEFSLADNEWFKQLYDIRGKWCPTFSADTFSANMRSIRRSDSKKSIFDHTSCTTTNLAQFVDQYEEITKKMRLEELEDDVRCNQGVPTRASRNSAMLKQAADVYTTEIFKLFQEEMVESLSIVMSEHSSNGMLHIYELTDEDYKGGHTVRFNSDSCATACSCKMFESMGLLCRHALRVLNMRNVTKIPAQYILKRWTKSARKATPLTAQDEFSYDNVKSSRSLLRTRLMHKAFCAVEKSLMTTKGYEIADALLDQIIEQVEEHTTTTLDVDNDNGGREYAHDESKNDINDKHCLLESTPILDTSHSKQKSQSQKKKKRKASKPDIHPGQDKQQIVIGPSSVMFPSQQIPTFFRPSFHPPMIGMDTNPYTLPTFPQGHFPPWVLSNFRPASPLVKTDQMPHTSQDSSTSNTANHT